MRKIFLLTAFVMFYAITATGQHFIKGKVLDENQHPLEGANVFIKSEGIGKITDKNGEFFFENLSKKNHQLEVSYIGFETSKITTQVDRGIIITLKPKDYLMNEIIITSLRANERSAVTYSEVKKEEIEKRNVGQDIPYLLAGTPSFIVTSDAGNGVGYTNFRIRGTDANRTNVTLNGVPLNDAESHGTFFVDFPDLASTISSFQIQRGVGTSTNGAGAFGASINMQTEGTSSKPYADITSSYGSFNTNKNTIKAGTGLINNVFAFDARLSNVTSDGYIDRAWVDMKSYYFSAGYYTPKTTIQFLTLGGKEKTYQAWNGVDAEKLKTDRTYNDLGLYYDNEGNIHFYDNQTDNYNQYHYHLHWLQQLNPNLFFNATAHLTRGIGYYEEYKQNRKYNEYGLTPVIIGTETLKKTDLVRQKWLDNYFYGFIYDLRYQRRNLNFSAGGALNRYDGDHYGKVIWVRNANQLDMSKKWYENSSTKDDANIYAKLNMETFKNLFASVDVQYRYINYQMNGRDDKYDEVNKTMRDITQEHTYHFFNPKLGLTWQIDKSNDIYGSYSISHREPNRDNFTEAGPNERPTYETLYDTELGYHFKSTLFSTGINLYYMKYKDQLILTGKISEIGEPLTKNIPDSYRSGIELVVGIKPSRWLDWNGNLTLSRNKIRNFVEEDVEEYDADWNYISVRNNQLGTTDIAYSPNMIMNSIFTFHIHRFEIGLHSNYVGKQFIDNTSDSERVINSYFVNNINLNYSLPLGKIKELQLQLLVNNVFNEKYETNGYTWYSCYLDGKRYNELRYFPQTGTNFLAAVRLKF